MPSCGSATPHHQLPRFLADQAMVDPPLCNPQYIFRPSTSLHHSTLLSSSTSSWWTPNRNSAHPILHAPTCLDHHPHPQPSFFGLFSVVLWPCRAQQRRRRRIQIRGVILELLASIYPPNSTELPWLDKHRNVANSTTGKVAPTKHIFFRLYIMELVLLKCGISELHVRLTACWAVRTLFMR